MHQFHEKAIISRIQQVREQYAGNRGKSKFAQALGISPSTYSYYEENRIPPIETLLRICEVTRTDLEWLLTGKKSEKAFAFGSNNTLLQKIDDLLAENPDLTEAISAFVELLCEKKGVEKKFQAKVSPPKPTQQGWVPVLGRTAAGMVHFWNQTSLPEPKQAVTELEQLVKRHIGKDIVNSKDGKVSIDLQARALVDGVKKVQVNLIQVSGQEQDKIAEFVDCIEIFELFPDSFALRIDGDSMSPRINDGDIVILSPSVPATQGQIAIARIVNQIGVTCKLFRTADQSVHLIPINERYDTKIVAKKDLLWALAVLCHVTV